jgi:hypothetical protein
MYGYAFTFFDSEIIPGVLVLFLRFLIVILEKFGDQL